MLSFFSLTLKSTILTQFTCMTRLTLKSRTTRKLLVKGCCSCPKDEEIKDARDNGRKIYWGFKVQKCTQSSFSGKLLAGERVFCSAMSLVAFTDEPCQRKLSPSSDMAQLFLESPHLSFYNLSSDYHPVYYF